MGTSETTTKVLCTRRSSKNHSKPPISGKFWFPKYLRSLGFGPLQSCPCARDRPPPSPFRSCLDTQSSHNLPWPPSPGAPKDALTPLLGWISMLGLSSQKGVLGRVRTMAASPSGTHSPTRAGTAQALSGGTEDRATEVITVVPRSPVTAVRDTNHSSAQQEGFG